MSIRICVFLIVREGRRWRKNGRIIEEFVRECEYGISEGETGYSD